MDALPRMGAIPSSPRPSTPKRMPSPGGDMLATIMENGDSSDAARANNTHSRRGRLSGDTMWSGKSRKGTPPHHSADRTPPPYASGEWGREQYTEKTSWRQRLAGRRGGLGRSIVIALVILLLLVALVVGLGVGLTRRKRVHDGDGGGNPPASLAETGSTQFPLGQYTFVTSLRSVQTDCTSNAETWRCYPYSSYVNADSTSGLALFNWVLTSDSGDFPSNATPPQTGSGGQVTSLKVSSSQNPFSIPISNQSLFFVNDANNPRYTFNFTYSKNVVPSAAVGGNNAASTCFFNQTRASATLYLSNSRAQDYPGAGLTSSSSVQGGYLRWPYAVEVKEASSGGQDVPACYETTNGVLGQRIAALTPESADSQCSCNYRNFDA